MEKRRKTARLREIVEDINPILAPLGKAYRRVYAEFERDVGIGPPQYYVLRMLAESDGLSQGEVGRLFEVEASRITRLAKTLEGDGLIERRRDPEDNRFVRMYITPEGTKAVGSASARSEAFERRLVDAIGQKGVGDLRRLLGDVTRSMSVAKSGDR